MQCPYQLSAKNIYIYIYIVGLLFTLKGLQSIKRHIRYTIIDCW